MLIEQTVLERLGCAVPSPPLSAHQHSTINKTSDLIINEFCAFLRWTRGVRIKVKTKAQRPPPGSTRRAQREAISPTAVRTRRRLLFCHCRAAHSTTAAEFGRRACVRVWDGDHVTDWAIGGKGARVLTVGR